MILLPTKGRPHNLKRYIDSYIKQGGSEPHCIILERNDPKLKEYIDLFHACDSNKLKDWIVRIYKDGKGAASHFNKVFAEFPNLEYYAWIADDVVPETFEYDKILKAACLPDKVAVSDEGIDRTRTHGTRYFPVHPFVGGELIRKWGFITPPCLDHFYVDNWIYEAGEQVIVPDVKLSHWTFKNGKAEFDDTYKNRPSSSEEKQKYLKFKEENKHLLYVGR